MRGLDSKHRHAPTAVPSKQHTGNQSMLICLSFLLFAGIACVDAEGVVLQRSERDCAPAAATMVLQNLGYDVSFEEVSARFDLDESGASVSQLLRVLDSLGVTARAWMLGQGSLYHLQNPAILLVDDAHFLVLDSVRGDFVFIRDPAAGRTVLSMESLRMRWGGVTIVMGQTDGTP